MRLDEGQGGEAGRQADFENAAQECRAERKADPDAFKQTYGTNHNGHNALGKCVSQQMKGHGKGNGTTHGHHGKGKGHTKSH